MVYQITMRLTSTVSKLTDEVSVQEQIVLVALYVTAKRREPVRRP